MAEIRNYGEIRGDMSDKFKDWINKDQYKARVWFDRNPYSMTIAEVATEKGREERIYED